MDAIANRAALHMEAERFHEIPEAAAILLNRHGVYRQAKVFRRGKEVYAGVGAGFLRLFANGGTSTPYTRYLALDLPNVEMTEDNLGRLLLAEAARG